MTTDFEAMREAMVESQLRTVAVDDARVVAAMARMPRERFVPEDKQKLAYAEMILPLGGGRSANLPLSTGRLLTALRLTGNEHVLVVGSAGGYPAALCAELAATVVALESDEALHAQTAKALDHYSGVEVVHGELAQGHADKAPYDAILVDGQIEEIPDALVGQLADNGRLAAALLEDGVSRLVIGRKAGDAFGTTAFADVESAPLPGFERPKAFVF